MKPNNNTAAICGLFCGTCPSFYSGCGGCLSQDCSCDCFNGFKDCAESHGVVRCYECGEFPCENLRDFSTKHIVDGICHHKDCIKDLEAMRDLGVEAWVDTKTLDNTCPDCGRMKLWYERQCTCKHK